MFREAYGGTDLVELWRRRGRSEEVAVDWGDLGGEVYVMSELLWSRNVEIDFATKTSCRNLRAAAR